MITPTSSSRTVRFADFPTLTAALDFAATGETGINLYSLRGELVEALPYATLRDQALALAPRLLATGAKPGQSVGLIADTEADFVRAFFACQYAGLVPAPLPLPAPLGGREAYVEQIARMLASAHAKLLIGPAGMKDWVAEIAAKAPLDFSGVLADLPESQNDALPEVLPANTCYLQFSSGSTRFPTGVLVTHRALMANAVAITRDGLKVLPTDRAVSWLPLYHDMGLIGFLLSPMTSQMSVDLLPTGAFVRRPLLWLDLIILNGRNIWPQDLEWTAEAEIESLRSGDVAAFSTPGEGEEVVVVLVQARGGDPETRKALAEQVATVLRLRHSVETQVHLVGAHALPQTSSGKLSRSKAKTAYLAGAYAPIERA